MNLANVRSAIGVTIALALLAAAPASAASRAQRVTLAWLPSDTTVAELAEAGLSPGVLSPGLGTVPAEQTYLDVTQGNRVFDSLYDTDLPRLRGDCPSWWKAVTARAGSAPAEIIPGLLSKTLAAAGIDVLAKGGTSCVFSAPPGSEGPRPSSNRSSAAPRLDGDRPAFEARESELRQLAPPRSPASLLIAIAKPTGSSDRPLPIGIAGRGFRGDLTSDSTRTSGYVLSTDLAPTILNRFGIGIPGEMSGQSIRSEGGVDPAAVESLVARLSVVSARRGVVIGLPIAAWLLLTLFVAVGGRGALSPAAVRGLCLSVVYLPLLLLVGAALEPGELAEALLVGIGSPLLALATLAVSPGYGGLAVGSAVTVLAYAADAIAGSPLTSLSLLGPNPGLGVRFYGIGNELEALLAVLVVGGTGAGLTAFARRAGSRALALAFLVVGLLCAFVFAAGRFGADVGAAIVFPAGAAAAAATVAGRGRRTALLGILAVPFAVLALLALIDLLSGANAHLTRSVLDAGGFGDLADVAQRRLQLSAHSFARPVLAAFLPLVILLAVLAVVRRELLRSWLRPVPAMRAGLLGALVATVVGTLANDSGALLLVIGTAYLLVFAGFAWSETATRGLSDDKKLRSASNASRSPV